VSSVDPDTFTPPVASTDYLIRHATLRQLQVFEAIVRLGSFTRAAEELFLTQPTVSMQTRKLADTMGLALFEHVGRNVKPTEAGKELYQACQTLFSTLSNLEMKINDIKGLRKGRLRMGVITTAKYLAPELLGQFSKLYPGIDFSLKVTNRERIIERMHANEDDLYITGYVPRDELEVEAIPFAPNPLVIIAPGDHPLVGKKHISLEEVSKEPFIMREPGSGIRDYAIELFANHGLQLNTRMELGSNEAIKHAVVGGLGLAVASLHTMTLDGQGNAVKILDVEHFPIMRHWYLVYPKGKELSLVARTFLDFASENESKLEFHDRMEKLWPGLMDLVEKPDKEDIYHRKIGKG
jgi:DNA-binding transcriptional LysR family regulator